MKRIHYLSILTSILILLSQNVFAQLFQQQFTDALTAGNLGGGTIISNTAITTDPLYVNNPASTSQFTFLSTNNALATIEINGDGVMRMARPGSGTVYVVRNTDFTGSPQSLMIKLDFNAQTTAGTSGGAIEFMLGQNFTNSNVNPSATDKHSVFFVNTKSPTGTPGTWGVTPISASSTTAFNTAQTISWYVNNSGAVINYSGPNGSVNSVADDTYDLWVGDSLYYSDQAANSGTAVLNNIEIRISGGNGTYTVDNLLIDNIPPAGTPPVVTTTAISNITQTTASSGGNVTDEGTSPVTVRGVCWSTNVNPTIADSKTEDSSGAGSFTSTLTSLAAGTTYYVRSYATSLAGTSYGNQETFVTLSGLADIVLSSDNPAVPGGDITTGSQKNPVYKFNLTVTTANTQLNQVDFSTAGTYTSSDLLKLQLWFNTLDNFGSAVQIGTDIASIPGGISNLSFGSLTQNINASETGYLWITADVSGSATLGNNLSIDPVNTVGLTFISGNKSGTAFSGGLQTIVAAGNPYVYFRTKATGDWNANSTWETSLDSVVWEDATLTPTNAGKCIHVRAPHTVTVTSTVSVDQVIVDSSAAIIVNGSPVVFTIVDGSDDVDMLVNGLLKATGSPNTTAPFTVSSIGILKFGSTGVYDHNQNSGGIPISQWTPGSTAMITGTTGGAPANRNQNYYNLTINTPANTATGLNFGFDNNVIGGDVTIINTTTPTGSGRWQLCAPAAGDSATVTINGNIIQYAGHFSSTGSGNSAFIEITVNGDILVTGGNFSVCRGSQGGSGTTKWYLNGTNFSMSNAATQNSNTAGAKFIFSGVTQQNLDLTNITFTGGFPVEVATNAILDAGLSQIKGSGIFTLNEGATLQTANTGGLDSLLQNTGTKTLSTLANYKFNGTIAQVTGNLLPPTINSLTVNNLAGVTLTGNHSTGILNLQLGQLNTGASNYLTVTGTSTASIVGGSETAFVHGPLVRTLPSSLGVGTVYNYPIGKDSYKPLALVDPVTTLTGPVVILAEVFDENSGGTPGTGLTSLNTNRYWSAEIVSGATELVSTKIRLTEAGLTSTMGIGKSSILTGVYDLVSSAPPSGGTITSDDITSLSFFAIGEAGSASTFQFSVSVTDGWNMVSVPGVNPGGQGVSTWWPNRNLLADVYKWNGSYSVVTNTTPGEGYWMLHTGAQTYNYPAIQVVNHDPIPLTTGWNMIGGYENTPLVSGLTTTPPGLIVAGTVYGWTGSYTNATNLVPGYGYWVLSTGNGVINPPTMAAGSSKIAEQDKSEWGKITLTDASGKSYTLYAVNGEVNLNQYSMPPLPPAGMFDVRYSSNRKAEDLKSSNQTIEMRGLEYPVTVRVEKMGIKLQDETGKIVSERLKAGEEVVISNSAVSKLMVTSEVIPEVYSLEQNYPNPFNPSTKIEFSIPEDVNNVTLTIYNALGQRVAELVNSKMEAGKYSYVWNASDVSTGLYIYELRTDKFVSVKKMMLLK